MCMYIYITEVKNVICGLGWVACSPSSVEVGRASSSPEVFGLSLRREGGGGGIYSKRKIQYFCHW